MEEKRTNNLAITAVVLLVVNIVLLFCPEINGVPTTYIIVGMLVISIVQIVLSSIAKKQIAKDESQKGMGMAKTALVLGIFAAVFLSISLFGLYILNNDTMRNDYICPQATECVDNGDGTSTCKFSGDTIICNNKTEDKEETPLEVAPDAVEESDASEIGGE